MPASPHSEKSLPNCPWKFQSCNQPFHQHQATHRWLAPARALKMEPQQLGTQHWQFAPFSGQIHCLCNFLNLLPSPLVEKWERNIIASADTISVGMRKKETLFNKLSTGSLKQITKSLLTGSKVCLSDVSKLPQEGTTSKEAWKIMTCRQIVIVWIFYYVLYACWNHFYAVFGNSILKWSFMISRLISWEIPTSQNRIWTSQESEMKTLVSRSSRIMCAYLNKQRQRLYVALFQK